MHQYIYVESLNLTANQRQTLVDGLKALAANLDHGQPAERNHWRVRLDGLAVIYEADFDDTTITAAAIRQRLATLFGVSLASITYTTATPTFAVRPSEVATYAYQTQPKVRFGVFGGRTASWGESWVEVTAYLRTNQAAWEPVDV